ncbi:MAG: TerC family protein [Paludibacteraceae bacterium]|nr:TerC family protein [Paludibacteraceae bacterium]
MSLVFEDMPLWSWIGFYLLVLLMLFIDLKSFSRKGQHEVGVREALTMTAVWIAVSLLFCAGIYVFDADPGQHGLFHGRERAMEFLSAYLIEKSLSTDNLFVFLMLFSYFGIERKYQHEVLFWGIIGALILRSVFIFAGVVIVSRFEWVLFFFGVILICTAVKMFRHDDDDKPHPERNFFVRVFKRFFPVTPEMHGDRFFIVENGRRFATPLLIALIVIETTDIAFAVDSIPAVFSVSRDSFVLISSNIFAVLGLRALYFALAAIYRYFSLLKYGISLILLFVGIKMILGLSDCANSLFSRFGWDVRLPEVHIPASFSLIFIFSVLSLSILFSVVYTYRRRLSKSGQE